MSWVEEATKRKVPYKFGERIMKYSKKKTFLLCPECGQPMKFQCLCPIMDSTCTNGHKWYLEYQGKQAIVAKGEGNHSGR